jgi:hypothetical protein
MAAATLKPKPKPTGLRRWLFPWTVGFQRSWLSRDLIAGIA